MCIFNSFQKHIQIDFSKCIYLQNTDGGDSDSEAEQEKIDELETYLKEYDNEFKE